MLLARAALIHFVHGSAELILKLRRGDVLGVQNSTALAADTN